MSNHLTQLDPAAVMDFCRRSCAAFDVYFKSLVASLPPILMFFVDRVESPINARVEGTPDCALVYLHPSLVDNELPRVLAHELTHVVHNSTRGAIYIRSKPALAYFAGWLATAVTDPAVITDLHAAGFDQRAPLDPMAARQFFGSCIAQTSAADFEHAARYVTLARCWQIIKPINAAGYTLDMLHPSPGARAMAEQFDQVINLNGLDTHEAQINAVRGMIAVSPFAVETGVQS